MSAERGSTIRHRQPLIKNGAVRSGRGFRVTLPELQLEVFNDILKADGIARVRLDQCLVSHKDVGFGQLPRSSRNLGGPEGIRSGIGGVDLHNKKMVEAETFEQGKIPAVGTHHTESTLPDFAEIESQSGQGAHECRVHEVAFFQIEHEIAVASLDHAKRKFLQALAIFECSPALQFHPNGPVGAADENTGKLAHKFL